MSHFPAGFPFSTVSTGLVQSQRDAVNTGNALAAAYTGTLNFGSSSTSPHFLFQTDSNRGRFFPVKITLTAVHPSANGSSVSQPVIRVGWTAKSNPYDNWVNQRSLQSIQDAIFGAGYYNNVPIETWEAFTSAPASTQIYCAFTPSTLASDYRVLTIFGIYIGDIQAVV